MCFQFISQALLLLLTWLRHGIERFPHYVQFVRGIYQLPVDSYHKGPSFDIFFDVSLNKRLNSAVTAVKYECDTINLTGTFARPNILLTDKLTKGASLYNPLPGSYPNMFPCDLLLVRLLVAAKKRPRWHKHTCLTHWGGNKMAPICRRHFQVHFLDRNIHILIRISPNFVPNGGLVQIMARGRAGNKPLSKPVVAQLRRHQWPLLLTWFNFNTSMDK